MEERNNIFFPYFYDEIWLFDCTVNFKFYLSNFIFLNINTNQNGRSNIWIKKQLLILGSVVQRGFGSKVPGLQFHRCFILYRCFWWFLSHFSSIWVNFKKFYVLLTSLLVPLLALGSKSTSLRAGIHMWVQAVRYNLLSFGCFFLVSACWSCHYLS